MLFCAHPWCWGSVGLRGRSILLPTKTSRLESQLFGRSAVTDRIGSQVDVTRLVKVWSCLTRVAITLSLVSLVLIARNQRAWISLSLCVLSCTTLSHLRTQLCILVVRG